MSGKIVESRPPILFDRTQPLIQRIERELGGPLISYWISPNGSVCMNDVNVLNDILGTIGRTRRISMFIKSDGGNGRASLRMVNLLRTFCDELVALVPLNCESAATMLALGADAVEMGPMAYLTPVDTSVRHDLSPVDRDNDRVSIGTNELERIVAAWRKNATTHDDNVYKHLFAHIHPLAIAAVDRAGSLSHMLCDEIMSYHMKDKAKRRRISRTLNADYPSHGYPIVLREARRIGIPARAMDPDLNAMLIELSEIYSEMGQKCRTDYDPHHHRDHEILNILECRGKMIYYELDKEWHYTESERTWRYTNERSTYKVRRLAGTRVVDERFHVR
jgi:hypothetical protein